VNTLKDLSIQILDCAGEDVARLAATLLLFCRTKLDNLKRDLDDQETDRIYRQIRLEAYAIFQEHDDEILDRDVLSRLAQLFGTGDSLLAAKARAVAESLEEYFKKRLADCLTAQLPLEVRPNEAFPVANPPLKQIFGARLNTDPETMGSYDGLRYVRLGPPETNNIHVLVHSVDPNLFANLTAGSKIAVGLPNEDLREFTWNESGVAPDLRFFGVKPLDSGQQLRLVTGILNAADSTGAVLLVLPELSIDASVLQGIRDWWQTNRRTLSLLVAGSQHIEEGGVRRNRSVTLLPGRTEIAHDKFSRFYVRRRSPDGSAFDRVVEDIARAPAISIHLAGDWSFAVLICKDLMDPTVRNLLEELRVRIVLVPACSPKTQIFEAYGYNLSVSAQAVVVVANTPPEPQPSGVAAASVGLFLQPLSGSALEAGPIQMCTQEGLGLPAVAYVQLAVPGSLTVIQAQP